MQAKRIPEESFDFGSVNEEMIWKVPVYYNRCGILLHWSISGTVSSVLGGKHYNKKSFFIDFLL